MKQKSAHSDSVRCCCALVHGGACIAYRSCVSCGMRHIHTTQLVLVMDSWVTSQTFVSLVFHHVLRNLYAYTHLNNMTAWSHVLRRNKATVQIFMDRPVQKKKPLFRSLWIDQFKKKAIWRKKGGKTTTELVFTRVFLISSSLDCHWLFRLYLFLCVCFAP